MNLTDSGIDLKYYLYLLRRRFWIVLLVTLAAAMTAYLISRSLTPVYSASTVLLVEAGRAYEPEQLGTIRAGESLATTYAVIMRSDLIVGRALDQVDFTPRELRVVSNPVPDTQLIQVRVEAADPNQAAILANTLATEFIDYIHTFQSSGFQESKDNLTAQLELLDGQLDDTRRAIAALEGDENATEERSRLEAIAAQYRQSYTAVVRALEEIRLAEIAGAANITQLDLATAQPQPIRPNVLLNTLLAALSGAAIAVGAIFAHDFLDDSLKSVTDLNEKFGLPVIGFFAHFKPEDGPLVYKAAPRSPAAESLRSIRVNLKYVTVDRSLRTLLVTSPMPGEGKSVFAANFSLACVGSGQSVALVDSDLRRPAVHELFEVHNHEGLSTLFIDQDETSVDKCTQYVPGTSLRVLASGPLPPNPSELLDTERATAIVDNFAERYDLTILDGPPITGLADTVSLVKRVDGVMLVLRIGETKMSVAKDAINRLRQVSANIVGIVLVDADGQASKDSSYYGYYYTSYARYAEAVR